MLRAFRGLWVFLAVVGVLVAVMIVVALLLSAHQADIANECAQNGGIYLRTYGGYECVYGVRR